MENFGIYQVAGVDDYLRNGVLLPADAGWVTPTRGEIRSVLNKAALDARGAADFLGVSRKEVNRWTTGEGDIPFAAWAVICRRAGVGYQVDWW